VSRITGDRSDRQACRSDSDSQVLAVETLRNADSKGAQAVSSGSEEKSIPMIWRIFGGTLLSIGALVAITLYSQLSNRIENLSDSTAKKLETVSDNLVKKQEFFDSRKGLWAEIQSQKKEMVEGDRELRERCVRLEGQLKVAEEKARDSARELQTLHETLHSFAPLKETAMRLDLQVKELRDERARLVQDLQQVRERIASVEGRTSAGSKKGSDGE
jgi:type VI protein secretion system component VasF